MQVKVLQNAPAILSTFIKLPFVIKIFVLSIFEWSLKTGFTVISSLYKFLMSTTKFGNDICSSLLKCYGQITANKIVPCQTAQGFACILQQNLYRQIGWINKDPQLEASIQNFRNSALVKD